jgi:ABC-type enterochelin transport system permease subunit
MYTGGMDPIPLGQPISQLYSTSLRVVGLAAFIMFLLAGLSYIIPENWRPGILKDPIEIIKNTIIGVVILFSAYVVLNSINPDLVGTLWHTLSLC